MITMKQMFLAFMEREILLVLLGLLMLLAGKPYKQLKESLEKENPSAGAFFLDVHTVSPKSLVWASQSELLKRKE
jgi:hypothetical protein